VLYVSAEESRQQVRARAERLGAAVPGVWLASYLCLLNVLVHIDDVRPDVVVIDSIQTMHDPELGSAPGTVSQVRDCANRLVAEAKGRGVAVILARHQTQHGESSG